MLQAYRYRGLTFLKFGRKATPGVMYLEENARAGLRPNVELWRDGTVTYLDRPEGNISQLKRVPVPVWAGYYKIKRFKSRS